MSFRILKTIQRRLTRALGLEIELSKVQRGLEEAFEESLQLVPLHDPVRLLRRMRKRAQVVLAANLDPSRLRKEVQQVVDEAIQQIPLKAPRTLARKVRLKTTRILDAQLQLPEMPKGLGGAVEETLDLVPIHAPRKFVRNVHRRARVVLRANLSLARVEHNLAQAVDEAIEQIPLETLKGVATIARDHTGKALQTDVGPAEVYRALRRILAATLQGMPWDEGLLVKQGTERSRYLNRQLAWSLAFVAGAVNAGGFLAVGSYTSHVTGVVSRVANEIILGNKAPGLVALGVVVCFFAGSFTAGLLISLGRRYRFQAHYALSLMLEAALLLVFGLMGATLHEVRHFFVPTTIALLSFVMGMHNSVVTTISNAEVRTTHLTGIVTDMGLEVSRLLYFNVDKEEDERMGRVMGNRKKLVLHSLILVAFFIGGLAGAVGFQYVGFKMTIFLSVILVLLAWRPVLEDIRIRISLVRFQGPAGEA